MAISRYQVSQIQIIKQKTSQKWEKIRLRIKLNKQVEYKYLL